MKRSILVVDDEPDVCASMVDVLESKGFRVLAANNGVHGLKLCAENKVDLIVLDLNMPRMDGYLFLEKLNEMWGEDKPRGPKPPVLVLTGIPVQTDLGLAKNLGAARLMSKPFRNEDFLEVINSLL